MNYPKVQFINWLKQNISRPDNIGALASEICHSPCCVKIRNKNQLRRHLRVHARESQNLFLLETTLNLALKEWRKTS
jgi:hypothetical protein